MAAQHQDRRGERRPEPPVQPDQLEPASAAFRYRLGLGVLAVTVLAVVLAAGGAPVALRAPVLLLAGTLVPGYALVVRLPVDAPTLLALDVCASLAVETAGAFVLVQVRYWHPMGLGLGLAVLSGGFALVAVQHLRAEAARGPA
ncbi:MAG: hypothetical protein JWO12_2130 [Frankiales bacterium]|nr:hypothetical protein [Frankiales bacterium]